MSFVLDCSVTMAWVFRDEATDATDRLRDVLGENRALVPALWPTETANVLLAAAVGSGSSARNGRDFACN